MWSIKTGRQVIRLDETAWSAALSPDQCLLAAGMEDGTIALWDVMSRKLVYTLAAFPHAGSDLAFSPAGLLLGALFRSEPRWAGVVGAVRSTLPVLDGTDEEALAVLIAAGPPTEEVGIDLDPYAIDPRLNPKPEPIDLTWGAPPPGGRPTSSSSLPSGSLPSFTPLVPRADRDRVLTEGVAR